VLACGVKSPARRGAVGGLTAATPKLERRRSFGAGPTRRRRRCAVDAAHRPEPANRRIRQRGPKSAGIRRKFGRYGGGKGRDGLERGACAGGSRAGALRACGRAAGAPSAPSPPPVQHAHHDGRPVAGPRGCTRLEMFLFVVVDHFALIRHEPPPRQFGDPLAPVVLCACLVHLPLVDFAVAEHQDAVAAGQPRCGHRPAPACGGVPVVVRSAPALDLCGARR
jgi:hypothetical protein